MFFQAGGTATGFPSGTLDLAESCYEERGQHGAGSEEVKSTESWMVPDSLILRPESIPNESFRGPGEVSFGSGQ